MDAAWTANPNRQCGSEARGALMPYLQVDVDALDKFADVGLASGLTSGDVCLGHLKLWRHCWKEKTAYVSRARLATFFRVSDPLIEAMVACEFIDAPAEDGIIHVRGAEKRLGLLNTKGEAGKKGGKASASTRKSLQNLKQFALPTSDVCFGKNKTVSEADASVAASVASSSTEAKTEALTSNIQHPTSNKRKETYVLSPPAPTDPQALLDSWRELTAPPLKRCREFPEARRKAAAAALRRRPLEQWREVFLAIQADAYCRGESDAKWVADFDWAIRPGGARPEPALRMLEGGYGGGKGATVKRGLYADPSDEEYRRGAALMKTDENGLFILE